jgi:uncharacterized membrane protein YraQ (UPF0718 family)
VTLDAVTPFGSCSSVPLFIGFVEAGIPLGVTFSFLIGSPMINEVATVALVGILGWKLAALYIGAGLLVAWFDANWCTAAAYPGPTRFAPGWTAEPGDRRFRGPSAAT